ncbi:Patatin-like phospholipase/acyl hydrolase [Paenimyroides ummariense]|uniref:Patatin-like phospholipase/acyl hydrolase n=1 Tax=Paenimyroides ummariense TaxID=913024 RepID=A0A1I5EJM7_9FLAO|nr:CBASS cGAMP-activated phospholipase [Paenimyroides ummariense]SFO11707.1 Patatin-like phospholipase/acyl hydrolase [Paenimyroides ummariense]
MEDEKVFKILSIDGGGIKGLYSARILSKFEEKFKCRTSDHFDMICGTSTGGLIALALTSLISADDICNFYEQKGEIIFPKHKTIKFPFIGKIDQGFLKQIAFGGKFSSTGLKNSLNEIFGNRIIGDANNLLCIPSYSVTEAKPKVFKYDHQEGILSRDNKAKMVDIALATSAAPTYFPMAELQYYNNEQFIDGGVWANNPTLVGLLEALNFFVGKNQKYNSIKILSLSSLSITGGNTTGLKNERSFKDWGSDLFETSMNGQAFFTDFFLSKVKEISDINIDYTRIPSAAISKEQESIIQLDVANQKAYNLMKIKADDQALLFEKTKEIEYFFTTPKTYITNG